MGLRLKINTSGWFASLDQVLVLAFICTPIIRRFADDNRPKTSHKFMGIAANSMTPPRVLIQPISKCQPFSNEERKNFSKQPFESST